MIETKHPAINFKNTLCFNPEVFKFNKNQNVLIYPNLSFQHSINEYFNIFESEEKLVLIVNQNTLENKFLNYIYSQYVEEIYLNAFWLANNLGFNYLERNWNYIKDINGLIDENNQSQYMRFNFGRSNAFNNKSHKYTPSASTGIGLDYNNFIFIFSKSEILKIENPNQTSSWVYPNEFGIKPPMFSRAAQINNSQA